MVKKKCLKLQEREQRRSAMWAHQMGFYHLLCVTKTRVISMQLPGLTDGFSMGRLLHLATQCNQVITEAPVFHLQWKFGSITSSYRARNKF